MLKLPALVLIKQKTKSPQNSTIKEKLKRCPNTKKSQN